MSDEKQIHVNGYDGPDRRGDPTANVRAMVRDAVDRLDGLREAETRRVNELAALRSEMTDKLSVAETKRIDAIRVVDVNAVSVASEKAAAQAAVLAKQVSESADNLRILVASTADNQAKQLVQLLTPITERLISLERFQSEGVGKGRATDPAFAEMMADVKKLTDSKSKSEGRAGLSQPMLLTIVGAVAAFATWLIQQAIR